MNNKFFISEEEKKYIKKLYNVNELFDIMKYIFGDRFKSTEAKNTNDDSDSFEYIGDYFVHPNADNIKLNVLPSAIPLNIHAEKLLKSIFAEAGTPDLMVSNTLRTYEDQARVNLANSESNILNWYGPEVLKVWKKYKNGEMTQQEYADFLKDRDKKRGKLLSNHLSGIAIDITPYNEKFASTAEKLMKKGNSGIRKVFREPSNNAVHIEFNFPVTDKGGIGNIPTTIPKIKRKDEIKSDKLFNKLGILVDIKNKNSSDYAIVFGGSPSSKYGAEFMYEQGKNYLKNKNVVFSDFENSLDSVVNYIKSMDSNAKITSVSGFSAGGKNAWEAATKGYKVNLIDPVVPNAAYNILGDDLSGKIPSNIKMISKQSNWGGDYRKHGENLSIIEKNNPNIKRNVSHLEMPAQFFDEYSQYV